VPTTVISAQSNDYVLDLLGTTEEKLVKLLEELETKDLEGTLKEMRQLDVMFFRMRIDTMRFCSCFSFSMQAMADCQRTIHELIHHRQSKAISMAVRFLVFIDHRLVMFCLVLMQTMTMLAKTIPNVKHVNALK
jgi:hypothetical protein